MNTLLAALINGFVASVQLAAVVWLALGVSRRWVNAGTRYAIWWILLALVVCLPFRYVPFPPSPQYVRIAATHAALPATAIAQPPSVFSHAPRLLRAETSRFPLRVAPGAWSGWIMAVWAIAALLMLLRLIVSYAMLWRMKRQAIDAPEVVAAAAHSALQRLGVTRRVRIGFVNDAVSPMVAGPFRPTILLPAVMLTSMDEAEIEQICLHEAAHLARRDDWALMVQRLIELLFAPHPLVRWIATQINLEREIACDDFVISVTGSARPYAACLTRIAELAGGSASSPAAAAVSDERSHLTRRVEMLLDKTRHAGARLLGMRLAVLACGLALVTFLAARAPGVVAFAAVPRTIMAAHAVPVLPAVAQELIAQTRPATRPPAPTPPPAPAPQEVRIAVNVTDPMNRFVRGLDADAFHVFENGVERNIVDFAPQAEPVSIAIVWDPRGVLADLKRKLPQIGEEQVGRVNVGPDSAIFINLPGSHVLPIPIGENQSIADGFESALDQLRGTPPEQAAVVLLVDPSSWPADRISAAINGAGVRVYVLGVISRASGSSTAALPALISAGLAQYPIVTVDQVLRSLNRIAPELLSQYFIGYVPSASAGREFRDVDVRLTPPAGLPELTAHVSSGRR